AVSSAGCHDNRMDKATWNEQWMGWPGDKNYEEVSNYTLAPRLQGRLFLAHGDVDENGPIPATIKLVDALVSADKDFDFLIMPNRPQGFGNDPYFVRRRWDYFVKHLLGVEPPAGFRIGGPRAASPTSDARGSIDGPNPPPGQAVPPGSLSPPRSLRPPSCPVPPARAR